MNQQNKVVFFGNSLPSIIPDKLFLDTSITLKYIIPPPNKYYLHVYINKLLTNMDCKFATSSDVVEETSFKIIDILVKGDLKQKKDPDFMRWTGKHYKDDFRIIQPHLKVVDDFHKWVDKKLDFFCLEYKDVAKAKALIKKYHLLPKDAFIIATALNRGYKNIAAIDKDFFRVDEIDHIYTPFPFPPKGYKK